MVLMIKIMIVYWGQLIISAKNEDDHDGAGGGGEGGLQQGDRGWKVLLRVQVQQQLRH